LFLAIALKPSRPRNDAFGVVCPGYTSFGTDVVFLR